MIEIKSEKSGNGVDETMTLKGKAADLGFEAGSVIVALLKRMRAENPVGAEILSAILKAEIKGLHALKEKEESLS